MPRNRRDDNETVTLKPQDIEEDYLDVDIFRNNGVEVQWMEYSSYPEYPQFHPPFDHYVSVLDLIFNVGPNAQACMERLKNAA
jgi:hypothetical protein